MSDSATIPKLDEAAKRLQEAVKQMDGQSARAHNLLTDTVLDLIERVGKLEADKQNGLSGTA